MAFYPAMNMGERILFIRENCGNLSQEEFANELGLTKSAISGYETGRRTPPDNVLKHIACVFHLDEDWLKDGVGEPFLPTPEDALEELFEQFECSNFERSFLTAYFYMNDKDRCGFSNYLEQIFTKMVEENKKRMVNDVSSESHFAPVKENADENIPTLLTAAARGGMMNITVGIEHDASKLIQASQKKGGEKG